MGGFARLALEHYGTVLGSCFGDPVRERLVERTLLIGSSSDICIAICF